jgi:hypothetical protein
VILLQADLHDALDSYRFAVNPDVNIFVYPQCPFSLILQREYVVIHFGPGYDDIAGKVPKLDHIANPNLRPFAVIIFFKEC